MEMKDVMVKITGQQTIGGQPQDSIELITDAQYGYENGDICLTYLESELTGMEGTRTTLSMAGEGVIVDRVGSVNSHMVFQPRQKNTFLYDTPMGAATLGIDTHKISAKLNEHGGDLEIDYVLDVDHTVIGRNKFIVIIREQNRDEQKWQI